MGPDRPEEDPVVGFLVRRYAPDAPVGPCPEEDLLAAMASGGLLPEERERLVDHLSGCERCGGVVAALSKGEAPGIPRAPSRRGVLRLPVPSWAAGRRGKAGSPLRSIEIRLPVAAAAVLLALAGVFLGTRIRSGSPGVDGRPASDTDGILLASAADLALSRPDLFRDFAPLSREERLADAPSVRGTVSSLILPAGKILETRPSFRWQDRPPVAEREVVLRTPAGAVVFRARARAPLPVYPEDAPPLDPGSSYSWTVSGLGERIFAVATSEERAAWEAAVSAIEAQAPAGVRDLLVSHLALRRGFLGEAEQAARRHLWGTVAARERYERELARARERGDRRAEGIVLLDLGRTWESFHNYESALRNYEQARAQARESGDRALEAQALRGLGEVHRSLGDGEKAREYLEGSLRAPGDPPVPLSTSADAAGAQTLRHVLRLLGSSEADQLDLANAPEERGR